MFALVCEMGGERQYESLSMNQMFTMTYMKIDTKIDTYISWHLAMYLKFLMSM